MPPKDRPDGGLTKTHVLISGFSGRAALRKCRRGGVLLALIRCGIPLSGGGSAENETSSVFCDAERPAGLGFA